MKNSRAILLVCICLTLCSFAAGKWFAFENKPGNFRIEFPGMPVKSEKIANTPSGPIKMNIFSYDGDLAEVGNKMYMLMYSDYPEDVISSKKRRGLVDTFFKNSIDGAVNSIHGKLVSTENADFNKYPGRLVKVLFAEGKGFLDIHFYLVNNRMYMLEVGYQKGQQNAASQQHFFKSFAQLQGKK
jgi:hypothetical protein